ncbi:hypothetical protein CR513_17411, partial [Mucuna pruriens]
MEEELGCLDRPKAASDHHYSSHLKYGEMDSAICECRSARVMLRALVMPSFEGAGIWGRRVSHSSTFDVLVRNIQKIITNCMYFACDMILTEKSREAINFILEQ